MRVVADTNVLVSGTFWTGVSFRLLELVEAGSVQLVLSPSIIREFQEVVHRGEIIEKSSEQQRLAAALAVQKLFLQAIVVEPNFRVEAVPEDSEDNKVLEAALAGAADYVVTHDRHLLKLKKFEGIPIVTAHEFLGIYEGK